jgi:hypothetical protein
MAFFMPQKHRITQRRMNKPYFFSLPLWQMSYELKPLLELADKPILD